MNSDYSRLRKSILFVLKPPLLQFLLLLLHFFCTELTKLTLNFFKIPSIRPSFFSLIFLGTVESKRRYNKFSMSIR